MGTKFDKNYMVVAQSGVLSEILIFDKKENSIFQLSHGRFKDITEDCLKLTKRKNKVCGGLWYQFLHNETDSTSACIWENGILYHTDNENEVNQFLFETRMKQLKFMLEDAEIQNTRYNNGKQAYTYKHCEKVV